MLEALVSSRVRRALLEYLLIVPADRFYLRGLAKQLGLSISPLRRELKRLERVGILTATREANVIFYTVNHRSPAFLQLQQAGRALRWLMLGPIRSSAAPNGRSDFGRASEAR